MRLNGERGGNTAPKPSVRRAAKTRLVRGESHARDPKVHDLAPGKAKPTFESVEARSSVDVQFTCLTQG